MRQYLADLFSTFVVGWNLAFGIASVSEGNAFGAIVCFALALINSVFVIRAVVLQAEVSKALRI